MKPEYVAEVLKQVNLGDPVVAAKAYPHLSAASLVAMPRELRLRNSEFVRTLRTMRLDSPSSEEAARKDSDEAAIVGKGRCKKGCGDTAT